MAAALPAVPQPGDERAVQAASLLGAAYLSMGSMDHCAALSERMLAAAERAGDQLVIAMYTAILAGVCYVRGHWTAAATWFAGPSSASPPVPRPWPCAGSDCWPRS